MQNKQNKKFKTNKMHKSQPPRIERPEDLRKLLSEHNSLCYVQANNEAMFPDIYIYMLSYIFYTTVLVNTVTP